MDSTSILIGLQVFFHSAMKHENDLIDMNGCFMKLINFACRLSLCLFIKSENNVVKKIQHVLHAIIAWSKLGKVCDNPWAGENPWVCLECLMICSRILPNVRLARHEEYVLFLKCIPSHEKYNTTLCVIWTLFALEINQYHQQIFSPWNVIKLFFELFKISAAGFD